MFIPGQGLRQSEANPGGYESEAFTDDLLTTDFSRTAADEFLGESIGPGPDDLLTEEGAAAPSGGEVAGTGGSLFFQMLRIFRSNKMAVVSLMTLIAITLFCFLGPYFYHSNQTVINLNVLPSQAPSAAHPLGTDSQGFDMLGRMMYAGKTSLTVGIIAAIITMTFGITYGVIAGYRGGALDSVLMRIVDVLLSIPGLFLLLAIIAVFGHSKNMIILIIGLVSWYGVARLMRAEALSLREREFAQAVRAMGGGSRRIIWRHVLPNSISTIVTLATFAVADSILFLAALGFLGVGIAPPDTDWGTMINSGNALDQIQLGYWWEVLPVAILFLLVVISLNFIGDALRDSFEVRLRER